jgi:arginase
MRLTVFQVPYDAGRYGERMGQGPLHLVERGLVRDLEADGHDVELRPLRLPEGFATEAGAAVQIQRLLAARAAEVREAGRLPVVLAGNCNATLGVLAAQPPGSTGLVWLDAHADFNTPETSLSGFFDGMSLAMITGAAWQALAATVPGFHPLPERDVILVGARDLDPAEAGRLAHSHITCVAAAGVPDTVEAALDHLARRVRRVHLHIDLDVLDPSEGRANAFAVAGGLALMQTEMLVAAVARRFAVAGVTLSAYDPSCDPDGRIARAAGSLLHALLEALAP